MPPTVLGVKIGMTRRFDDQGRSHPVTVVAVGPCYVTQLRTPERDGYAAVQIGFDEVKPRRSTMPLIAHDAKAGAPPLRVHREFRVEEEELERYQLGATLGVEALEGTLFVDVSGVSKGKGYQGGMKRHNFKGQLASHGVERKHRSPGSIAGHSSNAGTGPKPKKGKRMAGHMGAERVTVRSLEILERKPDEGLVLVRGALPGANGSVVELRPARRLYKSKASRAKAFSAA